MTHAVAVVSGGMDSVTLAYAIRAGHDLTDLAFGPVDDLTIVTVNYGQRHVKEIESARLAAARLDATHVVVDLRSITAALSGSALTDDDVDVPDGHYAADTMRATVVPNRNAILASIAYGVGVARDAPFVALGMHAGDHTIYPDCRPEFIATLGMALHLGNTWTPTESAPALVAPFIDMNKAQIAALGDTIGVPWADTWSCYRGDAVHCGRCGTCVERAEAFHDADVDDPTEYADPDFWRTATGKTAIA